MSQIIKLSDKAADRIKSILSNDKTSLGVRIGVKSGGCAGMSYVMEYAKSQNPNDELIEEKGVKVFIDPGAVMYLLGTTMDFKEESFRLLLYSTIPMKLSVVDVESPLKYKSHFEHICIA